MTYTAAELATTYLNGSHQEPTEGEREAFDDWLCAEFFTLPCRVEFVDEDVSPETMLHHFKQDGVLVISTLYSEHPILTPMQNWMFRAIHDHHHVSQGFGFDLEGEIAAAEYVISTAPESIHWLLWSEVALQAGTAIHTGEFAAQKLVKV